VPLAAFGVLGLAAVVAVHELAEVVVILNGVRAGSRRSFASHPPLESHRSARAAPPAASATPAPSFTKPRAVVGQGGPSSVSSDRDCC
jgi:cation-transporting ATPase G